jgi:hypothetical protein
MQVPRCSLDHRAVLLPYCTVLGCSKSCGRFELQSPTAVLGGPIPAPDQTGVRRSVLDFWHFPRFAPTLRPGRSRGRSRVLPISDCGESFSRKVGGVYVPRYLLPNCVECPAPGYIRLPSHARCTAVCTPTSMPGIEFISRTAMQRYACLNSYDQGQAG